MAVIAFAHVLLSTSLEGVHKCCSILCVSIVRLVCKGSNELILRSVACQIDITRGHKLSHLRGCRCYTYRWSFVPVPCGKSWTEVH